MRLCLRFKIFFRVYSTVAFHEENKNNLNQGTIDEKMIFLQKTNNLITALLSLNYEWIVKLKNDYSSDQKSIKISIRSIETYVKENSYSVEENPHYTLEIIAELFKILKSEKLKNVSQVSLVVDAIRESLKYLGDQERYEDLEQFRNDSVTPFRTVVNGRLNQLDQNLKNINLYFLYNRKLNQITLDRSIELFKQENLIGNPDFKKKLRSL